MNYEISDFTQLYENKSTRFQSRKACSVHQHLFFGFIRCFNDIHMLSKYMAHQFFDCIHIAHINPLQTLSMDTGDASVNKLLW